MPVLSTTHRYHFKDFEDARRTSLPEKKTGVRTYNKAIGWLFSKFGKAFKVKEDGQTIWLNAGSARNLDTNSKKCPDGAYIKKCKDVKEAVQYLMMRFPTINDMNDFQDDAHAMALNFIPLTPVSN